MLPLREDRFDARIHQAGEDEISCREEVVLVVVKNRDESLEALIQGEKPELWSQQRSPFAGPVDLRAQVADLRDQ